MLNGLSCPAVPSHKHNPAYAKMHAVNQRCINEDSAPYACMPRERLNLVHRGGRYPPGAAAAGAPNGIANYALIGGARRGIVQQLVPNYHSSSQTMC